MRYIFTIVKNNSSNKNYSMLSTKDLNLVYETLLTSPGMNEIVKIDLKIPRRNVLILTKLVELGLTVKNEGPENGLLHIVDMDTAEEFKTMSSDILKKAGLTEMNDKINSL